MPWTSRDYPSTLKHRSRTLLAGLMIAMPWPLFASGFECELGKEVVAGLGDGVTMRTCRWEKSPGNFVRAGPLQLVKNGILVLQLQTDRTGRLQGQYTAWDDAGVIIENGAYRDGLKEGEWLVTDDDGHRRTQNFRAGELLDPFPTDSSG
ncbi:MAG: hypothetical protein GY875_11110 [Gammaproteobacteria bacterium]|nr:hypothetical protein [Gammaproteobacteria bacterium]